MKKIYILLDIDGVLETTPSWKTPQIADDDFYICNPVALNNLKQLYQQTHAEIVLTTTHRINHSIEKWYEIFEKRGLAFNKITKINEAKSIAELKVRSKEIEHWVSVQDDDINYVVLDDKSISNCSETIKNHWVKIDSNKGFKDLDVIEAIQILALP